MYGNDKKKFTDDDIGVDKNEPGSYGSPCLQGCRKILV